MLRLIVNADDFGLNTSCTRAIAQSFRAGHITDTTIVANGEAFEEAVSLATTEFIDKVGIHFNLTEGEPLTEDIKSLSSFCLNGLFHGKINRGRLLNKIERRAVYKELSAQCNKVREAGVRITHADSHHHIHTGLFIAPIVLRVCRENGIQIVRSHRNIGQISPVKKVAKAIFNRILKKSYKTTDYMGGADDVECTRSLKGVVEIMVHPDFDEKGNIIDRRGFSGPLLGSIKYWDNSTKICFSQLP